MDDEPVIKYAIKQGRKFKTYRRNSSGQLAFAVKNWKSWIDQEMFNNSLADLKKSGQYQKILDLNILKQIASQVLQILTAR